ncbi:MAG: hypothetical protein HY735_15125 [Verrucomicrobia bacterium]|nr:hypothetical protein [Verrucomicrobiota bacterium]
MTRNESPRELVAAYSERAEHTLRFMARNIVAKAQKVVWQEYPDDNPSQVVRAISQRCTLAVENPEALKETQSERQTVRQSRGIRM